MPPKRKRQMADKDQNKGKASKSHPTIQLDRRPAEMTSQFPPCGSSHAISRPTDPPAARTSSDVIPPSSIQEVHSLWASQPTNPDAGCALDMSPKKRSAIRREFLRQQMADRDQNKGKASENHPTIQHTRRLAQMTPQIPPCASSHAISRHTDLPARTSDVIPPPSVQGAHSPCTSQPTNPDAGSTLDMASKKSSAIHRKFVRRQMAEKDQNKGKASMSHPTKQRSTRLAHKTSQIPPCGSSHAISCPSDPPARTSDATPPPSMEGVHSPCISQPTRTSNVRPPPSMKGVHSPHTSQPTNSYAGPTFRSFVALEAQSNDGKPILYLEGQGFLPSRPAANGIGDILKSHYTDPWPSWKKIPNSTRDLWFKEFLGKFSVSPPDYNWAKKNFEMRGSVLMKNNLNKARTTMDKPSWIEDGVWESLCKHWRSEGFKKKSTQAKTNRASNYGASHTGGSITTSQHIANMKKETGAAPTPLELFRRTHQHKDNTWVDRRSQHVNEAFTRTLKQLTKRAFARGEAPPSELDVWCDVARSKKGKVYGLGMESRVMASSACCHGSCSSSMEWVKKQEFDELTKEMEEVRNEREMLQARVANTERLVEHNNALIRELVENMNMPSVEESEDDDDDEESLSEP